MRIKVLLALGLLLVAGCGDRLPPASGPANVVVARESAAGGLVQTVYVSSDEVRYGERLRIESRITNRGPMPAMAVSRTCGLDIETPMQLELLDTVRCAAYSERAALAPGDSRVQVEERIVASPPGRYLVRVRHLLDPRQAAIFTITVRPAAP